MKKGIALLLALAMMLALCACGGQKTATAADAPAAAELEVEIPEAETAPEAEPPQEEPEEELPPEEPEAAEEELPGFQFASPEYTVEVPVYEVVSTVQHWDSFSDDKTEYTDYALDEQGRVIHYKEVGTAQGENLEYDDLGRLIGSAPDKSGTVWVYEYDENGFMVRSENSRTSDPEDKRVNEMVNDEMGNKVERYFNGELAYTYENTYDDNGFLVSQSQIDADDGDTRTYLYEYDALGRIAARTEDNYDGDGTHDSTFVSECIYDDLGFMVREETEQTFDEKGDLSNSSRETNWSVVGYYTVSSDDDASIYSRDLWEPMEAQPALPAPESVFAGITPRDQEADGSYSYVLENTGYTPYEAMDRFTSNFIGMPPTHSMCEGANYAYWVYLGALASLGYETRLNDRGCMVIGEDGSVIAEINRGLDEAEGCCLMLIHVI